MGSSDGFFFFFNVLVLVRETNDSLKSGELFKVLEKARGNKTYSWSRDLFKVKIYLRSTLKR